MKSSIEIPQFTKRKYPVLARSKGTTTVVLFTNNCTGTVVHSDSLARPLGMHDETWTDVRDEEVWEILSVGTAITLTQDFSEPSNKQNVDKSDEHDVDDDLDLEA